VLDREGGMDVLETLSYRNEAPPALTQRAAYLVNTYYGEVQKPVAPRGKRGPTLIQAAFFPFLAGIADKTTKVSIPKTPATA